MYHIYHKPHVRHLWRLKFSCTARFTVNVKHFSTFLGEILKIFTLVKCIFTAKHKPENLMVVFVYFLVPTPLTRTITCWFISLSIVWINQIILWHWKLGQHTNVSTPMFEICLNLASITLDFRLNMSGCHRSTSSTKLDGKKGRLLEYYSFRFQHTRQFNW